MTCWMHAKRALSACWWWNQAILVNWEWLASMWVPMEITACSNGDHIMVTSSWINIWCLSDDCTWVSVQLAVLVQNAYVQTCSRLNADPPHHIIVWTWTRSNVKTFCKYAALPATSAISWVSLLISYYANSTGLDEQDHGMKVSLKAFLLFWHAILADLNAKGMQS